MRFIIVALALMAMFSTASDCSGCKAKSDTYKTCLSGAFYSSSTCSFETNPETCAQTTVCSTEYDAFKTCMEEPACGLTAFLAEVQGEYQNKVCTTGDALTSDECKAIGSMTTGYTWNDEKDSDYYPKGCAVNYSGRVYFNTHATGNPESSDDVLCKATNGVAPKCGNVDPNVCGNQGGCNNMDDGWICSCFGSSGYGGKNCETQCQPAGDAAVLVTAQDCYDWVGYNGRECDDLLTAKNATKYGTYPETKVKDACPCSCATECDASSWMKSTGWCKCGSSKTCEANKYCDVKKGRCLDQPKLFKVSNTIKIWPTNTYSDITADKTSWLAKCSKDLTYSDGRCGDIMMTDGADHLVLTVEGDEQSKVDDLITRFYSLTVDGVKYEEYQTTCPTSDTVALNSTTSGCPCGAQDNTCVAGFMCKDSGECCYPSKCSNSGGASTTLPARGSCDANHAVCLTSQSGCGDNKIWVPVKVSFNFDECTGPDDSDEYAKYTCVSPGTLNMKIYSDAGCTTKASGEVNERDLNSGCNTVNGLWHLEVSWTGECVGSSANAVFTTTMAFVLTAFALL